MKLLQSRVGVCAITLIVAGVMAVPLHADIPAADYKTVTSKAYVDTLIHNSDISGHKVNGLALSNENIYFYATEVSGENINANGTKTVQLVAGELDSGTANIPTGMVLVIKPAANSTVAPTTLVLKKNASDTTGISGPLRYNGAAIPGAMARGVWNANNPSVWAYDGQYWNFVGGGGKVCVGYRPDTPAPPAGQSLSDEYCWLWRLP